MKKALVNYWIDLATGIAFLLCAVTGIVFLFPGAVHTAIGATPTILLIPAAWWHTVHDWTGVAMVAGTALHLALHAKWITVMTRRTFGAQSKAAPARAARPARAAGAAPQPAAPVAALAAAAQKPAYRAAAEADAAAASLRRLEALDDQRGREREQRISRRRFLAGAAAVGGVALLAGVGLVGRDVASGASSRLREDGWADGGQGQSGSGTSSAAAASGGDAAGSTGTNGGSGSGGSAQSASSSGSSSASSSVSVAVDQSACVACGRCLQVCPRSVFDWSSSGRAAALSPDACIRCGRCLQVCPAGAISVSA